jgi:hypothetical protein
MSNPHIPVGLTPVEEAELAQAAELDAAWDRGYAAAEEGRRWRVAGILLAAIAGAVLGASITALVVHAAPRTAAEPVIPAAATEGTVPRAPAASGNLAPQPSGAPRDGMPVEAAAEASREATAPAVGVGAPPKPEAEVGTAIESGIASYVNRGLGPRYLALPEGPGHRVRICAGERCLERTSTDAGPDLAMQRAGRVADLSFADFAWLCRCDPPTIGLLRVTIERSGPGVTAPPTDVGR